MAVNKGEAFIRGGDYLSTRLIEEIRYEAYRAYKVFSLSYEV